MIESDPQPLSAQAQLDLSDAVTLALMRAMTDGLSGTDVAQHIIDRLHALGRLPKGQATEVRSSGDTIHITVQLSPPLAGYELVLSFDWRMQNY